MQVLPQVIANRPCELGQFGRQVAVKPWQHERQTFAQMSDHDLQLGKAVEHAAENETDDVNRSLDMPTPCRTRQHVANGR